jgi:predicted O-methyltransferase YrrM
MESSYFKHGLGLVLYYSIIDRNPKKVVEFGVLQGYSTTHIAWALEELRNGGTLTSYDLWDKYPYKHGNMQGVSKTIEEACAPGIVTLREGDFFEWIKNPEPFDVMHLDISNDGDIVEMAIEGCLEQIRGGSAIIFEGGSEERDREPWMLQYGKRPIRDIRSRFPFTLLSAKWPSISIFDRSCLS